MDLFKLQFLKHSWSSQILNMRYASQPKEFIATGKKKIQFLAEVSFYYEQSKESNKSWPPNQNKSLST